MPSAFAMSGDSDGVGLRRPLQPNHSDPGRSASASATASPPARGPRSDGSGTLFDTITRRATQPPFGPTRLATIAFRRASPSHLAVRREMFLLLPHKSPIWPGNRDAPHHLHGRGIKIMRIAQIA